MVALPCATCWNGDGFLVCYTYSRHRHLDVDLGTQRCVRLLLRRCGCRKKAKPTASSCGPVPRFAGLTPPASVPGLDPPQPTSVPGLGSPCAHPRGDWARPAHICTGTALADATTAATWRARAAWGRGPLLPRPCRCNRQECWAYWARMVRPPATGSRVLPRDPGGVETVLTRYSRGTHAILTRCSRGTHTVIDTLRRVRERTLLERRT